MELKFNAEIIEKHPKNYQVFFCLFVCLFTFTALYYVSQVWFHRQKLTEWRSAPGAEFKFTAECLEEDAKNYHVWQYRQWLLEKFPSYYPQELEFVDSLIKNDVRNNSAWNQRYYVLSKMSEFTAELVRKEVCENSNSPWCVFQFNCRHSTLVQFSC